MVELGSEGHHRSGIRRPRDWSATPAGDQARSSAPATRRTSRRCACAAAWSGPSCRTESRSCCSASSATGCSGGASRGGRDPPRRPDRDHRRARRADLQGARRARSNALANAWRERGLKAGEGVAILVRNHRGFLDARVRRRQVRRARSILLNTSFAGPQIREVAEREGTDLLVYDDEYSETLEGIDDPPRGRFRAWADEPRRRHARRADRGRRHSGPPKPDEAPKITILTSGTTGTPKGAPRSEPRSLGADRRPAQQGAVPRARGRPSCACRCSTRSASCRRWSAIGLGSTLVVRRRFDPETTLESLEEHKATAMVVVPGDAAAGSSTSARTRSRSATCRRCGSSSSAARRSGAELAKRALEGVRPGDLQPVRLDRDRLRDDRHARGPRGRAGHRRQGGPRLGRQDLRRGRQKEVPEGESGRIFVGNLLPVRGLHRRRQQGHDRRA